MPVGIDLSRTRTIPNAIILQTTIDIIGFSHIGIDIIVLADCWRVTFCPCFAIVIRDINAAIVAIDQMARTIGIDPKRVMIAVNIVSINAFPRFAPVFRLYDTQAEHVHFVRISRIDPQLSEIITISEENILDCTLFMRAFP